MTREQTIEAAARQATETPMADIRLIAGVIDILSSLGVIRLSPDLPSTAELHNQKHALDAR